MSSDVLLVLHPRAAADCGHEKTPARFPGQGMKKPGAVSRPGHTS
jgi:hypothetical protein